MVSHVLAYQNFLDHGICPPGNCACLTAGKRSAIRMGN
ncbi:hypothetical protein LEMLEM_LOCUS23174 [Lemmus lemmus]